MALQLTIGCLNSVTGKFAWTKKVMVPLPGGMIQAGDLDRAIGRVTSMYDAQDLFVTGIRIVNVEIVNP